MSDDELKQHKAEMESAYLKAHWSFLRKERRHAPVPLHFGLDHDYAAVLRTQCDIEWTAQEKKRVQNSGAPEDQFMMGL